MASKKKKIRCEGCGVEYTHYVLETDVPCCDNEACHVWLQRQIEEAVRQYKEQEEFERGWAV